eukprot:440156_1
MSTKQLTSELPPPKTPQDKTKQKKINHNVNIVSNKQEPIPQGLPHKPSPIHAQMSYNSSYTSDSVLGAHHQPNLSSQSFVETPSYQSKATMFTPMSTVSYSIGDTIMPPFSEKREQDEVLSHSLDNIMHLKNQDANDDIKNEDAHNLNNPFYVPPMAAQFMIETNQLKYEPTDLIAPSFESRNCKIALNSNTDITFDMSFIILKKILEKLTDNNFGNDVISLFIDHFGRYKIMQQIKRSNAEMNGETFAQLYWSPKDKQVNQINVHKIISNMDVLSEEYSKINNDKYHKILFVNGENKIANGTKLSELSELCEYEFRSDEFRFIAQSEFYYSIYKQMCQKPQILSSKTPIECMKNAFRSYSNQICPILSVYCTKKINDNIFAYWVYMWVVSIICRKCMEPYNENMPLQLDLTIIPNDVIYSEDDIDCISDRLTMNNIQFNGDDQPISIDPSNIQSLIINIERCVKKCIDSMSEKQITQNRIIILVDRRRKSKKDNLFCFIPPTSYAHINKDYEILSCLYNTSQFILPQLNDNQITNATNSNLFVFTYLMRSKLTFKKLYNGLHVDEKEAIIDTTVIQKQSKHTETWDHMGSYNCVVNNYLFYNGGFCRFEPNDLVQIMPCFFTSKSFMYNSNKMFADFHALQSCLWNLMDDIWAKWNHIYALNSNFNLFSINKTIEISNENKEKVVQYCRKWQKTKDKKFKNDESFSKVIDYLHSFIDDNIDIHTPHQDDIIITNDRSEYFIPSLSHIPCSFYNDDFDTVYDIWSYCNAEIKLAKNHSVSLDDIKFDEKWQDYNKKFPLIELTPHSLIEDCIVGYQFCTVAISHIANSFAKYQPFQICMAIIVNNIRSFPLSDDTNEISVENLLSANNIPFKCLPPFKTQSINKLIGHIKDLIHDYNKSDIKNKRLVIIFDKINMDMEHKDIEFVIYVYETKAKANSKELNLSCVIPTIKNTHPKLFIINIYSINNTLAKCYFLRNGRILRFFPEHMETVWPHHFVISDTDINAL